MVVTGGSFSHDLVTLYSQQVTSHSDTSSDTRDPGDHAALQGWVGELPRLAIARAEHACGHYVDTNYRVVGTWTWTHWPHTS